MDENRVEGGVREVAGKVQSAAGDFIGDAKTSAQGRINEAVGQVQSGYGAAADQVRGVGEELAERIQETPLLAVLGALGLGYLLGRLASR